MRTITPNLKFEIEWLKELLPEGLLIPSSGLGTGRGRGRNKGGAFGTGGYCVCARCGERVPHQQGVKCNTLKCPKCHKTMIREELLKKGSSF